MFTGRQWVVTKLSIKWENFVREMTAAHGVKKKLERRDVTYISPSKMRYDLCGIIHFLGFIVGKFICYWSAFLSLKTTLLYFSLSLYLYHVFTVTMLLEVTHDVFTGTGTIVK